MAEVGQVIEGPGGFRLRIARIDQEVLEMEATYGGTSGLPPEHFHPRQAERFEGLEGKVRAGVDGTEHSYEAGDVFEVPADTPHQMTGDGPARVNWQVRPALRTAEFFERLYDTEPGAIADFLAEFSDEIRFTAT